MLVKNIDFPIIGLFVSNKLKTKSCGLWSWSYRYRHWSLLKNFLERNTTSNFSSLWSEKESCVIRQRQETEKYYWNMWSSYNSTIIKMEVTVFTYSLLARIKQYYQNNNFTGKITNAQNEFMKQVLPRF